MPFNKMIPTTDAMISKANEFLTKSKEIKAIETLMAPIKKELGTHFTEELLKDLGRVKAEVPSVFCLPATRNETMADGTVVATPTGETVQVQAKVSRKPVLDTESDTVLKAVGAEVHGKLIVEELILKSAPMMDTLRYAMEHPEFCTISVTGTDTAVLTITGVDKLPGITTEVSIMPVEGFLDAVRDLTADARKSILPFIKSVLARGLGMAVAAGNKSGVGGK